MGPALFPWSPWALGFPYVPHPAALAQVLPPSIHTPNLVKTLLGPGRSPGPCLAGRGGHADPFPSRSQNQC